MATGRWGRDDHGADLVELHRMVGGGRLTTACVLGRLGRHAGCPVLLFDRAGRVVCGDGPRPDPAPPAASVFATVRPVVHRVGEAYWTLVPFERDDLVLGAVGPYPLPPGLVRFLADAVWLVAFSHGRERHEAARLRLAESAFSLREGVVTLVLSGQLATAQRVAARLGDRLPEPARVLVVDTDPAGRDRVAADCAKAGDGVGGGLVWVARCLESERHVLVVAPAEHGEELSGELAAVDPHVVVGVGPPQPLRHTAFGYERVRDEALPAARRAPCRCAVLAPDAGPAWAIGAIGRGWADAFLRPLAAHEPARAQDPCGEDLTVTVRTWLAYGAEAPRRLYVHRNTLTARLRLVGALLDVDLTTVAGQAVASLALGFDALPPDTRDADDASDAARDARPDRNEPPFVALDSVLSAPAARAWAVETLCGVLDAPAGAEARTLRAWLAHDTRIGPTATALGISVAGLRKRLCRLSRRFGADLRTNPPLRHDLWLALRVVDA
ncbi:helix-turn-helix domain-containing protein [Yinghuangia seranimata]|uniref:helix-turn-helix domain-containing protein n=1 Tax=Yinghuangia seranimata TaxID=408067 RepID=UPI00248C6952|nr:helix-turn-helix domain-containing protein [Yinghuangia seranimata]MDI2130281.1 helix-turn-helix domain-containing protein [Yinghuangia seranimata]